MKIISILAMGKQGEMGTLDTSNHMLPWKRSMEDIQHLQHVLKTDALISIERKGAILLATTNTYRALPISIRSIIKEYGYVVVLLTSNLDTGSTGITDQHHLLDLGNTAPNTIEPMVFYSRLMRGLNLLGLDNRDNLLYFGSPTFAKQMLCISDYSYITVFQNVMDVAISHELGHSGLELFNNSPKTLVKKITNGHILRVNTKCINTNNY